jgi:hypothetical protein
MTSWNERQETSPKPRIEPRQIPWRLFALEALLVLVIVGAVWLAATLT